MDNNKIKHLDYIQNIITRMNSNSFQIKTWTVTIVTALLAISINSKNSWFIVLAILPTVVLWFLDAYYLNTERKFRALYNEIAGITSKKNELKDFEMSIDDFRKGICPYFKVLISPTIILIYSTLILLLILINCIIING